nr:unnamed protein product [Callosobruchus analis]
MPTRNQSEFERSLIDALRSNNVANAISEAIISTITKKLADKLHYYDTKIASLEAKITLLKVDSLQQQTKNNNNRLIGVKKTPNENTQVIVQEILNSRLKMNVDDTLITAAYSVGQKSNAKARHIVVMLRDNKIKNATYSKKRMLKGSGIVMKERLKVVKEASEKYGFKNVWTVNGVVFAKTDKGVEKVYAIAFR